MFETLNLWDEENGLFPMLKKWIDWISENLAWAVAWWHDDNAGHVVRGLVDVPAEEE